MKITRRYLKGHFYGGLALGLLMATIIMLINFLPLTILWALLMWKYSDKIEEYIVERDFKKRGKKK